MQYRIIHSIHYKDKDPENAIEKVKTCNMAVKDNNLVPVDATAEESVEEVCSHIKDNNWIYETGRIQNKNGKLQLILGAEVIVINNDDDTRYIRTVPDAKKGNNLEELPRY